jgi:predicted adenine nucleotide alpha hydrolase (AANH) superfamily ATPase
MKLLFHCCCAPCVAACQDSLLDEGISPALFWYNPNIHPYTEYRSRRDSLKQFGDLNNLELEMIDEYGLRPFIRGANSIEDNGPESGEAARCIFCYRLRLAKAAAFAVERGFDAFGTSLLASPYQRHDAIRSLGEELALQYRIAFLYRGFRPHFREGQKKAREGGLYMQKYCGCIFSEEERYNGKGQ